MASNLPGDICVGQHSVCLVRAAILAGSCAPLGGVDSGFVSAGIVTATASVTLKEGQTFEPETGCGNIAWTYEQPDLIRSYELSGELVFFDHEMMEVLFGGSVVVGGAGSAFTGQNIGWSAPNYTDDPPPAIYLEFVTLTAAEGVGTCDTPGAEIPAAVGHIFGRTRLVPGDRTFAAEAATVAFTGTATANPNLGTGPWNDWAGEGNVPNSPYIQVSYSRAEYEAMADLASCGYQTLPAAY